MTHLHLLAAGALTLLDGMDAGGGMSGSAALWMRGTWAALGCSILLGGVALYGATARNALLAKKMAADIHRSLHTPAAGALGGVPVRARRPTWLQAAETGFLTSLCIATICLVGVGLTR
jgi:hypothetical protein